MSRHHLTVRADVPGAPRNLEIIAGWDGPLQTYFAQVIDLDADEESDGRVLLWLGTGWKAEPSPRRVLDALKPWAVSPYILFQVLMAERDSDLRESKPSTLRLFERGGAR